MLIGTQILMVKSISGYVFTFDGVTISWKLPSKHIHPNQLYNISLLTYEGINKIRMAPKFVE